MNCWKAIKNGEMVCPHCHADQEKLTQETYVRRLMRALHHIEPETPIRAAFVPGELKPQIAVPELIRLLHRSADPCIAAACAQALGTIGGTGSREGPREALSRAYIVDAIELAQKHDAELCALWVRGSLPHYPETVDEVEEEKEAATAFLQRITKDVLAYSKQYGVDIQADSLSGHPAKTILSYAEKGGYDLIVLGNRGHSELWGRFLGHTADKVSENAHCSVLIVRR